VDVSPKSFFPWAILRKSRLITFPDLVFGIFATITIFAELNQSADCCCCCCCLHGTANFAICVATASLIEALQSAKSIFESSFKITKAIVVSP